MASRLCFSIKKIVSSRPTTRAPIDDENNEKFEGRKEGIKIYIKHMRCVEPSLGSPRLNFKNSIIFLMFCVHQTPLDHVWLELEL